MKIKCSNKLCILKYFEKYKKHKHLSPCISLRLSPCPPTRPPPHACLPLSRSPPHHSGLHVSSLTSPLTPVCPPRRPHRHPPSPALLACFLAHTDGPKQRHPLGRQDSCTTQHSPGPKHAYRPRRLCLGACEDLKDFHTHTGTHEHTHTHTLTHAHAHTHTHTYRTIVGLG